MRRILFAVTALSLVTGLVASVDAAPRGHHATDEFTALTPPQTKGLPDLDRIDPVRYRYDDAVVEYFQVRSRDGVTDIWVDVIRPKTPDGVRLPIIMMPSPYYNTLGRGFKAHCKPKHQATVPGAGNPLGSCAGEEPFPEWYDEYFVPRGYAYAAMDLRGTRNTGGCQQYGDRDEVLDAVDAIDFLVEQDWSNGKVGLTGGSYDGTIASGAAVEMPISGKHKDAVAAVIPIRAIDAWYDYHFFNGVQSSNHAATPALFTAVLAATDNPNSGTDDPLFPVRVVERKACIATLGLLTDAGYASPHQNANAPFWSERDFAKDALSTRAAWFFMHGLFDFNVKTNNVGNFWTSLPAQTPKKLWLFNSDHTDPRCPDEEFCRASGHAMPYPFADRFIEANHRWWLQFLKGVPAGALANPVEVQRDDGTWSAYRSYPGSRSDLVLYPSSDGSLSPRPVGEPATATYADGASSAPASVSFVSAPFPRDTRLSGQFQFDLAYTLTGTDTTFAVTVADLPPGAEPGDALSDVLYDREPDGPLLVTYGWLRANVRASVSGRGRSVPTYGLPVVPGMRTVSRFPSLYTDFVVRKGHSLRFSFSNQAGGTVPAAVGGTVSLLLGPGETLIRVPVAPLR